MPAKIQQYPVYVYDEPVTYNDFTGGINTDPSNEHLLDNEMRDCVNMHYLSGALVKRKGAKEVAKLISNTDLHNIQGVFLFTYRITYIIIAADGKLYYGVFNENTDIFLERLDINVSLDSSNVVFNPSNLFVGLDERYSDNAQYRHEGFIHSYELIKNKIHEYKYRGRFEDITNDTIYIDEVVTFNYTKYKCIKEHSKVITTPADKDANGVQNSLWRKLSYSDAYESWKKYLKTHPDSNIILTEEEATDETKTSIPDWEPQHQEWLQSYVVKYQGSYYRCERSHYNFTITPGYNTAFWKPLDEAKRLIFQNYRKVEAATFNNKLYIATGTRFIEIALQNNRLVAYPVQPHICNNSEITLIGYNYMSPYPELCRGTQQNTTTTSIGGLIARKNKDGSFILEPQMNFQTGDTSQDYLYRWEKKINNQWYVIHTFKSQDPANWSIDEDTHVPPLVSLKVYDANKYQYRVTFAQNFEKESLFVKAWDNKAKYNVGDYVSVGSETYQCLIPHQPSYQEVRQDSQGNPYTATIYDGVDTDNTIIHWENSLGEFSLIGTVDGQTKTFWKQIHEQEPIQYLNTSTNEVEQIYDYAIDEVTGGYFGQAISVLARELEPNDTFKIIQTCTKLHVDGDKILLYGDRYNSGQWFKTIIKNPGYITDKGCLSFKTTKNEALIKITAFQGNIICFANSENIGGSIHLVQGNGDDYDAQDGYYSPYRRSTINASISCDNPDTVQICDNLLVFKYFNRVYFINASDLSNEVIQVTPCNDRLMHSSKDVEIPWDDNSCISEVTDTYYGLIWKEKYKLDKQGTLILKRPGLRVKMYYKMANRLKDNSYTMPWLRDESTYLNVDHCFYIKGKPLFLYNNVLVSFEEFNYDDLGENYECKIHFRGVDLGYPKMLKIISNVLVYYHRNQYTKLDFNLKTLNEAGHLLLDSVKAKKTIQDLKVLKADSNHTESFRVDSTMLDTRIINSTYKFPCFLADTIITCKNDKEFSLSSITYNYTTLSQQETNAYDLYTSIIRKKDLLSSKQFKGGN